ncbi:MAG: hypothetical protein M3M97_00920 [Actinomycetota bacterium]|nr:hypothetical protein [Actinomycetota bacterium]
MMPLTFSLLVYALPLLGIYMNSRDRWWLFAATVALAITALRALQART